MKLSLITKLFSLLILFAITVNVVHAQTEFSKTTTNSTGRITNTGTDTLYYKLPGYWKKVGIQPYAIKDSGTVAGSAILQGAISSTNSTSATGWTGVRKWIPIDTLTFSNQAVNSTKWEYTEPVFLFYRILMTGSGTMEAKGGATIVTRK